MPHHSPAPNLLARALFTVLLGAPSVLLVPGITSAAAAAATSTAPSRPAPHVYETGGLLTYGDAPAWSASQLATATLTAPITAMAATPNGEGLLLAGADGAVYTLGQAGFHGSFGTFAIPQYAPVVSIASTPDGGGYWLASEAGGVFTFGDAGFYGSLGDISLAQPVVSLVPTHDGKGYWLFAADGGVFSFGDAVYYGSPTTLPVPLAAPIMGAAATPDGKGYWLVGADGGIFTYGDAGFYGSGTDLDAQLDAWNAPIIGIAPTPDGQGYWLASANGGVYTFGDAGFYGSEGGQDPSDPVNALAATTDGKGYWLFDPDGYNYSFTNPETPSSIPQARALVSLADSQVAPDLDQGTFCNPYGPCEAWCSLFSTWLWQQVGVPIPSYAFTGDVYDWSAANGSVLPANVTPPVGDVVMYGYAPTQGNSLHTGTVVQTWPNGAIVTIEGDAGPDLDGHYSVIVNGPFIPADWWAYNNFPVYAYAQP